MKILLVNPNRYHFPPVLPVGLEYLYGELLKSVHEPFILDLCFSKNPENDLIRLINEVNPDIAGISVRHIDTVLYQDNRFFIDEIKQYVGICRDMNLKVILGGVGFSIMPAAILKYTGADYGIAGAGERALTQLLDNLEKGEDFPQLSDGFSFFSGPSYEFSRAGVLDYSEYIYNDGIVGFRTQTGCTAGCFFCTEGGMHIIYGRPESVGREICGLKQRGYTRFHLCDSEFNLNLNHCINVCRAIVDYAGPVNWTLYMKPEPYSEDLFRWLAESGASLITLSIDTKTSQADSFGRLAEFFRHADDSNIKVAIDLSAGYPHEKQQETIEMIEFLNGQPVETVGINSWYRVYPGTPLHKMVTGDGSLQKYMVNFIPGTDFLTPVFFNYFSIQQIREWTEKYPKFRIEGSDMNTNYQRVR
jgi:radical SAM superfamily enzyme YgiQ (UPF0313 family)